MPDGLLRRKDEIGNLGSGLKLLLKDYRSIAKLAEQLANGDWRVTLHEIEQRVQQVSTGANEVSAAAQHLSAGAQESASSVEEISASMQEISGQTQANAKNAGNAQETNDLIATSGQEIKKGGEVTAHTSEVLNSIVAQIKETSELVGQIAVASNEQAQGVNQIAAGLQRIDAVTQQNTASTEQSASAANEMTGAAKNLQKQVAQFQLR